MSVPDYMSIDCLFIKVVELRKQNVGGIITSIALLKKQRPLAWKLASGSNSSSSDSLSKQCEPSKQSVYDSKPGSSKKSSSSSTQTVRKGSSSEFQTKRTKFSKGGFDSLKKYLNGAKNSVLQKHAKSIEEKPTPSTVSKELSGKSTKADLRQQRTPPLPPLERPKSNNVKTASIARVGVYSAGNDSSVQVIPLQLGKASTLGRASNFEEEMRCTESPKFVRSLSGETRSKQNGRDFASGNGNQHTDSWDSIDAILSSSSTDPNTSFRSCSSESVKDPNGPQQDQQRSGSRTDKEVTGNMFLQHIPLHSTETGPLLKCRVVGRSAYKLGEKNGWSSGEERETKHNTLPRSYGREDYRAYPERNLQQNRVTDSAHVIREGNFISGCELPNSQEIFRRKETVPLSYTFASVVNSSRNPADSVKYTGVSVSEKDVSVLNGESHSNRKAFRFDRYSEDDQWNFPYSLHRPNNGNVYETDTASIVQRHAPFPTEDVIGTVRTGRSERQNENDSKRWSLYDNMPELDELVEAMNNSWRIDSTPVHRPAEQLKGWTCLQCKYPNPQRSSTCQACSSSYADYRKAQVGIPCPGCGRCNPREAISCTSCECFLRGRSTYI